MRRAPLLPALFVALIAACDGAPVEPAGPVHVTSVDTPRPGQLANVRGSGLTRLLSLLLDGVEATELVARSDSVAELRVRAVNVSAIGSAPVGAVVYLPPSVSLRRAGSRVLTEDDPRCLRLPATDEDHVLSAANLAIPTAEVVSPRMLVSVRLLGARIVRRTGTAGTILRAGCRHAAGARDARIGRAGGQLLASAGALRPALCDGGRRGHAALRRSVLRAAGDLP